MAGVEVAHRRNEADRPARSAVGIEQPPNLGDRAHNHRLGHTSPSIAANRRASASIASYAANSRERDDRSLPGGRPASPRHPEQRGRSAPQQGRGPRRSPHSRGRAPGAHRPAPPPTPRDVGRAQEGPPGGSMRLPPRRDKAHGRRRRSRTCGPRVQWRGRRPADHRRRRTSPRQSLGTDLGVR